MRLGETKIGKPIELFINRDGFNYRVVSKIEEVSENRVCISLIASSKRVFEFLDTDVIEIVYRNDERMWKWTNVKGSITELDGEKFHCLTSDSVGEPYNRRNAFRVNINQEVEVKHKVEDNSDLSDIMKDCYHFESYNAVLRDISEEGVGFFADELFPLQDDVEFTFTTDYGDIKCHAVIVRFFVSRHGAYSYYYGCRLLETSKNLTKYIYEMQRLELRRTKGVKRS